MMVMSNTTASSSNWGGFMRLCDCGVPSKVRTVTKDYQDRGRKFRGCGNYPIFCSQKNSLEKDCKFFDWLYDDRPSICSSCEKNGQKMDTATLQIDSLNEKLTKMNLRKVQLKETIEALQIKLCQVNNKKNMWKYGGLVALAISWIWFTFVLSGK